MTVFLKLFSQFWMLKEITKSFSCATQKVEDLIKTGEIAPNILKNENIELAHYGNTKGRNDFQAFDTVIIVGKMELSDDCIRRLTRCLMERSEAKGLYPPSQNRQRIGVPVHGKRRSRIHGYLCIPERHDTHSANAP